MKRAGLSLSLFCLLLFTGRAQGPASVKVAGEVLTPLTLTAADLAAMPQVTASAKDQQGVEHLYSGVAIADIHERRTLWLLRSA